MGLSRTVSVINGVFRGKFQSSTPNTFNASTDEVSLWDFVTAVVLKYWNDPLILRVTVRASVYIQ